MRARAAGRLLRVVGRPIWQCRYLPDNPAVFIERSRPFELRDYAYGGFNPRAGARTHRVVAEFGYFRERKLGVLALGTLPEGRKRPLSARAAIVFS